MTKIKLTDLLCEFLKLHGVSHVFSVTGGSILHPLHSAHKCGLTVTYTHHEQAASFAADAATRILKRPQACFITTGPAGTNALTGVLESWHDSIPQIIISGQARIADLTNPKSIRQIGSQHTDIVSIVSHITNKVEQIINPNHAVNQILSALFASNSKGVRPGPVWIDIPLDIQWVELNIDERPIEIYNRYRHDHTVAYNNFCAEPSSQSLSKLSQSFSTAKKPLIVLGSGIRNSSYCDQVIKILSLKSIPVALTWGTLDLLESSSPFNVGLLGVNGQRSANLAAYFSDQILGIGTHFADQITGRDKTKFAPNAEKYILNIDKREVLHASKFCNAIEFDLESYGHLLCKLLNGLPSFQRDMPLITHLRGLNSIDLLFPDAKKADLNIYSFYRNLYQASKPGTIFVSDGGGNTFFGSLQHSIIQSSQRIITTTKTGCMGSGLPQAIGASKASPLSKVICFIGDGSIQFNVQELQTIKHEKLNILIILVNNGGYQAIKDTQSAFFDSTFFGVDDSSGLSLPSFAKISYAYEINYFSANNDGDVCPSALENLISKNSPTILEIFIPPNTPLLPSVGKSDIILDKITIPAIAAMSPDLPDETYTKLMKYKTW